MNGGQAPGSLPSRCDIKEPFRCCEHFLGARDSFFDGGIRADESVRNFAYAEAAQDMKNECDLRLLSKLGMAAREHHAQLIVLDRVWFEEFIDHRCKRPFTVQH